MDVKMVTGTSPSHTLLYTLSTTSGFLSALTKIFVVVLLLSFPEKNIVASKTVQHSTTRFSAAHTPPEKNFFVYHEGGAEMHAYIFLNLLTWQRAIPDWNLIILNEQNIRQFIPDLPVEVIICHLLFAYLYCSFHI